MKIVVAGLGYVGLSNAVLLAQHNEVIGVDTSQERVPAKYPRQLLHYAAPIALHLIAQHIPNQQQQFS